MKIVELFRQVADCQLFYVDDSIRCIPVIPKI